MSYVETFLFAQAWPRLRLLTWLFGSDPAPRGGYRIGWRRIRRLRPARLGWYIGRSAARNASGAELEDWSKDTVPALTVTIVSGAPGICVEELIALHICCVICSASAGVAPTRRGEFVATEPADGVAGPGPCL